MIGSLPLPSYTDGWATKIGAAHEIKALKGLELKADRPGKGCS